MGHAPVSFKITPIMKPAVMATYRGRFAPSPTGALHFGSLVTAIGSWLRARSRNGTWLVRVEDIDPPREIAGAIRSILDTLAAFGLESDEPVLFQSTRSAAYAAALDQLIESGHAFACACSRADVQARGGHRGRCSPTAAHEGAHAWRMLAPATEIGFDDVIQGFYSQHLQRDVGDVVLRRADGLWAYQLAVVVDDAAQGITEIVRGADLLDSTPRQIALQQALGLPVPAYAHVPALLGDDEQKLSKQTYATPVDARDPMPALRHALKVLGISGKLVAAHGSPARVLAAALPAFALERIPRTRALRSATWTSMANR